MSLTGTIDMVCPKCHHTGKHVIHQSVNVSLEPNLRTEVLTSQSLFHYECPSCGVHCNVEAPFLYHDMNHNFMIWFHPGEEELPDLLDLIGNQEVLDFTVQKGYRFRMVRTITELRDKIIQLESPYPDYALEWCKVIYGGLLLEQAPINEDIHTSMYTVKDDDLICIFPLKDSTQSATLSVKGNQMDELMKNCPIEEPEKGKIHRLNVDWVIEASKEMESTLN